MAVPGYLTAILLFPVFFGIPSDAFEETPPIPQGNYEASGEPYSFEHNKRFPDHFNNIPPSFYWFNVGECPETDDGIKQFYCPSLKNGKSVCIDDHQLCNGVKECPNAEDENSKYCLFYKPLKANLKNLERDVQNLVTSYMRSPARRYSHGIGHQEYR